MELSETLRILFRRWYILLIGMLITCGLGWAVLQAAPTTYQASATLLLMPSEMRVSDANNPNRGNPYLSLSGMGEARDVVVRRANSAASRANVLDGFNDANYTLTTDPTTQSPIILVEAESSTSDVATSVLKTVVASINQNLDSMQSEQNVPQNQRIRIHILVIDQQATANNKTRTRAAIVTAGAGMVGTLLTTGWLDGIIRRRHHRVGHQPRSGARRGLTSTTDTIILDDAKSPGADESPTLRTTPPEAREQSVSGDGDRRFDQQSLAPLASNSPRP